MTSLSSHERILPLPSDVAAQIRSSIVIRTLEDVIVQLLCNSIDANSSHVEIRIDFSRGSCVVEDNGVGIASAEFGSDGGLGKPFHTSRAHAADCYGRAGSFLNALSALSVLTVSSRRIAERSQNTLLLRQDRIPLQEKDDYRISGDHGTRVTVRNLFGNMPVRIKYRALSGETSSNEKEWEQLTLTMTSFVLASPRVVAVSVRDERNGRLLKLRGFIEKIDHNLDRLYNPWRASSDSHYFLTILTQASLVTQACWPSWVPVSAKTASITIKGAISLDPAPNKRVQFISVGIRPLAFNGAHSVLYGEVNRLFSLSRFGATDDIPENKNKVTADRIKDVTQRQLKGIRKGIDRWPMFCFWIEFLASDIANYSIKDTDAIATESVQTMIDMIEVVVTKWLGDHHFRPPQRRPRSVNREAHLSRPSTPSELMPLTALQSDSASSIPHTSPSDEVAGLGGNLLGFGHSKQQGVFSSWSRIKSGISSKSSSSAGQKSSMLGLGNSEAPATLPSQQNATDRGCGCDDIHDITCEERTSPDLLYENEQLVDDLVRWQHPTSRDVYSLNIRSGVMFKHAEDTVLRAKSSNAARSTDSANQLLKAARLQRPSSSADTSSVWLSGLADRWKNPVFKNTELQIPQIASEMQLPGEGGIAVQSVLGQHPTQRNIRLSSECLRSAEVLDQLDKKFILLKVTIASDSEDTVLNTTAKNSQALVLVDQHAADERCKVELLLEEICSGQKAAVQLQKSISFMVSDKEASLLEQAGSMFCQWGVFYSVSQDLNLTSMEQCSDRRITVKSLPSGIYERCISDVTLLTELLRGEAWNYRARKVPCQESNASLQVGEKHAWLRCIGDCPKGIVDMLNSRACRSAIMFNDELTKEECRDLINRLSKCAFPFQCAHGRPSMVPLVDIESLEGLNFSSSAALDVGLVEHERQSPRSHDFSDAFKHWQGGVHIGEERIDVQEK